MTKQDISKTMEEYIVNNEMSCGALVVRKNDKLLYRDKWGYADLASKTPIQDNSIFRMASMTKCVTAVAVMQQIERGNIGLDDRISRYIPGFARLQVQDDERYQVNDINKIYAMLPAFHMDEVKTVPAVREITVRDLLSHASGLEQGWVGLLAFLKMDYKNDTLESRIEKYQTYALDFQPGTSTSYSPAAGFDILIYILQMVTGESANDYLKHEVFEPLEMVDAFFWPDDQREKHIVTLYNREGDKLVDVTGTGKDIFGVAHIGKKGYISGCGGLYCTLEDYDHFARMLCNEGCYKGKKVLKPETVQLMHTEAQKRHLEPEPGFVWGLSVKIRQDPVRGNSFAHKGTYGWSGAFGTHFFVCPDEKLETVFVTNRADLGGSGSYISRKIEELIFGIFGENGTGKTGNV